MARQSKEERLQSIHRTALLEFGRTQSSLKGERQQCLNDRRFATVPGAQWEGTLQEQFANRPRFEVNKVYLSLLRILNEYRNNRISVDFVSKDGTDSDLADVCDGLYRADEADSCADEAYDNAFEEGTTGGFGAWRLRERYENEDDPDDERQRIRIEPIFDADTSVYFDLDAKRQDKSDAKWCIVLYSVTRQEYGAEHGDDPATWPKDQYSAMFDWYTPDVVYIAEYYRVEEKRETVHVFTGLDGKEERYTDDELEEMAEKAHPEFDLPRADMIELAIGDMKGAGTEKLREKRVKRRKVRKYIMSGGRVLEDCGYIAGRYIPIIPFYGTRRFIDNVERVQGHVRAAKDLLRLYNMLVSKLAEISASSQLKKPILTPDQIAGHQVMWAEDNLKNYPYLLINPVEDAAGNPMPAGALGYVEPMNIPEPLAALLQLLGADIAELLGSQQQGDKMVSNISGKAVEMIQQRLDMQAFIYMSNFAKAMKWCGVVWLSKAKDIYVEQGRRMKSLGEQGDASGVTLMQEKFNDKGELYQANDLTKAAFDVAVDVGPSFTSKRDATVRALTGVLQMASDPSDQKILTSLIMMNMEGEGLGDVREFKRKELVQMGVLQPNDEERKAMAEAAEQQQPDPNTVLALSMAEKEKAQADKYVAETAETVANTGKIEAETLETLSHIGETATP